jgi:HK97 family phage portal protein
MSPIRVYAESIGLTMAVEDYGARFFGNDARPGGVLTHPGKLSPEAQINLKASWEESHRGLTNAHRVAVLEEGMTWQQTGLPPEAAQFITSREFQLGEVARIWRVPPHMLYHMQKATWANVEQMETEFLAYSIHARLVRIEQAMYRDLLLPSERKAYFVEHLVDGLLRGDSLSRNQAYAIARNNGWLNADEIRDRENLNPIPNGQGKIYLVPMNMIPADQVNAQPASGADPTPTNGSALPAFRLARLLARVGEYNDYPIPVAAEV